MNLAFLNPLFLFGLAAGVIPILIHRLTQRKARVKKFSAVRLLQQSQQNLVRPERLKQLLLLALRVLAVLSLALLAARPVWIFPGVFSSGQGGAKALIVDNSLSMGFREDRGERFALAKKKAGEILAGLSGPVLLLPTVAPGEKGAGRDPEWMSPERARQELEALSLSFGRGDPEAALNLAFQGWKDSKNPLEAVILTDLARGDWEGFQPGRLKGAPADLSVTILRFGEERRDANRAVREVSLVRGEGVVGSANRLEAAVSNFSDQPASVLVELHLDGAKAEQKPLDLKAGEEGRVAFDLFLARPGWVQAEVRLREDRLPLDDRFFFPLRAREKVRALVVDGDPRPSLKASESYYLVNALQPGGGEGSAFLPRVIQEGELSRADLAPYEAVFLLNLSRPPGPALASFVGEGKPLFIFLGGRVDPEHYGRLPFFPWQLKEVGGGGMRTWARIGGGDSTGEFLGRLAGVSGESLGKASFYRYFRAGGGAGNLLTLENGDPLLAEARWGKGRVFLFSSGADLKWNDLPLNAAYLPLIQGLLKEAVGLSAKPPLPGLRWGEPFPQGPPDSQTLGVPGGPGIYRFLPASGEARQGLNPPPEESDLGKMSAEEIGKRLAPAKVRVMESREDAVSLPLAGRLELWPYILGFLLLLLGAEMGVAGRL